jgi:hypothetical protein
LKLKLTHIQPRIKASLEFEGSTGTLGVSSGKAAPAASPSADESESEWIGIQALAMTVNGGPSIWQRGKWGPCLYVGLKETTQSSAGMGKGMIARFPFVKKR